MKLFNFLLITSVLIFSGCEKSPFLAEAPFEFDVQKVNGNTESSFTIALNSEAKVLFYDVEQDQSGSYLILGLFRSEVRTSNNQPFIARVNPNGELVWLKKPDVTYQFLSKARFLDVTTSGFSIMTMAQKNIPGTILSVVAFDNEGEVLNETLLDFDKSISLNISFDVEGDQWVRLDRESSLSLSNNFIKALQPNSTNVFWEKSIPFYPNVIKVLSDGNIIVSGDQIPSSGQTIQESYLQKYSSTGDSIWSKTFVNDQNDDFSLWRTFYAAENGSFLIVRNNRDMDNRIVKYDSDANELWSIETKGEHLFLEKVNDSECFLLNRISGGFLIEKIATTTGESIWSKTFKFNSLYSLSMKATQDGGVAIIVNDRLTKSNRLVKLDTNGN